MISEMQFDLIKFEISQNHDNDNTCLIATAIVPTSTTQPVCNLTGLSLHLERHAIPTRGESDSDAASHHSLACWCRYLLGLPTLARNWHKLTNLVMTNTSLPIYMGMQSFGPKVLSSNFKLV